MSCSDTEELISLDQALAHYATVQTLPTQRLDLIQAHQHILAEDVISSVSLPLFTQSAVDGYACRSEDIKRGMREFELIGEIRAGVEQQIQIKSGQMLRIFTGGQLPASADTVARQEIVSRQATQVVLNQTLQTGSDIRYQGEELKTGCVLALQGQRLNSGLIAALSMAGVKQVTVYTLPRIAVLITGDEVNSLRENTAQVFDANAPMILTWLKEQGFDNIHLQHVPDDQVLLTAALSQTLNHYDLVLSTGGVSVGDYDLIRPVSMALGAQQIFWQVAQKPGKPLYFAQYQQSGHRSYLLGLPGNPAAVFICLALHVASLLRALQGVVPHTPNWQKAQLHQPIKPDHREQLVRMILSTDATGQLKLSTLNQQQSHMLSNLKLANAIVRIPALQLNSTTETLAFETAEIDAKSSDDSLATEYLDVILITP